MSSSETEVESDLLGGLDIESSDEISVPDKLIDQVIGQEKARDTIKKAAKQRRHLMMIGSPGTGKSMLSKAMTEILPSDSLEDVLVYPNEEDDTNPKIRTVPAGQGKEIVEAHEEEVEKKLTFRRRIMTLFGVIVLGYSIIIAQSLLLGIIATGIVYLVYKLGMSNLTSQTPKLLINRKEDTTAPFEDATGAHSGALLGDVRHDPFQSSDRATPAHNRIESGKIHESNQGVLFIDEINTLDVKDQQKLMTAIQEGEFSITGQSERSSGAMVQTDPVPTDFIMVAAGNMDAIENMHPALRDRIKGYGYEVYMDDKVDDSAEMRQKYAQFVAQEVERDENIPHFTAEATAQIVKEAKRRAGEKGKLTLQLRDLGGIVRTAGDLARADGEEYVSKEYVAQAKEKSKSIEQQVADEHIETKEKYGVQSDQVEKVGYVNGLAVMGDSSGILLPIVSTVTPSQGPGEIIATGNLQEIAQEAVSNVSAVIKKATGKSLDGNDIHIQFVQTYEGVDGDSASVTVATAVLSSLTGVPIRQDVAMTGSLSVQGEVLPVGGVTHKIEAAAKSGMNTVIIPRSNEQDVLIDDEYKDQIEIVFADHIGDVLEVALAEKTSEITAFIEQLRASQQTGLLDFSELNPNNPSSLLAESSD